MAAEQMNPGSKTESDLRGSRTGDNDTSPHQEVQMKTQFGNQGKEVEAKYEDCGDWGCHVRGSTVATVRNE